MVDRLAVGKGFVWSTYELDGQEHVACYLNRGDLVGLVRHNRDQGWHVNGSIKGRSLVIPDSVVEELRGTAPYGYPVIPEQMGLIVPADVDVDSDAYVDALSAVVTEYGLIGPEAWKLASEVVARVRYERTSGLARRIVVNARLEFEAGLSEVVLTSVRALLDMPRPPRVPVFGQLFAEGHNATVVARWKVGKSTFVDNAAVAAAGAGMFLGRFESPTPLRVCLFNYELHDEDMADRLSKLMIPIAVAENITVVNLRGRRLPLLTSKGRDTTVRLLADNGSNLWIVDPFGAAFVSAGGEDENSNAEVRRFLMGLDEIKRLAGCESLLMPLHTGRRNDAEGDEQGRGATVLEDWPDVRMLLTKDKQHVRFLRTEGRAWELGESRLGFDEITHRVTLARTDVGISRRQAHSAADARTVADVVAQTPGMSKRDLRDALSDAGITATGSKDEAISAARLSGLIHVHTGESRGHPKQHYVGPQHADAEPCDEER